MTIYIVLGILYESYIHPFTILTGLPSAVIGALVALRLFGMDLSLIAVVGLLMLIGIVKKNAIMMIDVALVTQREGKPPADAIYEAALLRFRPIMMTTLAALLGVLPIAVGHRRRRRAAPAARRRAGRRPDRVAGADALHDADALHLHGAAVGADAKARRAGVYADAVGAACATLRVRPAAYHIRLKSLGNPLWTRPPRSMIPLRMKPG